MIRSLIAAVSASPMLLFASVGLAFAQAPQAPAATRISGPAVHENLAVYFIRGPSAPGKVPLTLEEAMARRVVQVRETGNVNKLEVENLGNEEVFIQSGDIVKGGQQDRTLMVSLVLPPKSGRVAIDSFCVEQGRWSARGREDVKNFATSSASVPSRELKLAMKAPKPAPAPTASDPSLGNRRPLGYANETGARQSEVWNEVAKMQDKLSGTLGGRVQSSQSASSLQLALENERLAGSQKDYVAALKKAGEGDSDIIGFVFAVNGKLNSADVYPSNGLFRKMWGKLLNASVTEAISHRNDTRAEPPAIEAVAAFLADAERGKAEEKPLNAGVKLDTRDGDKAYYFETARAGAWVHRNYLAK